MRRWAGSIFLALIGAGLTLAPSLAIAEPPRLSLPIACAIGPGCQIQNYVDNVEGAAARDFACGGRTYDGHKGTDFRLRDVAALAQGVDVLAAADGVVKSARDGMADVSIRDANAGLIKGRECGNGVVLDHGDGWVTQYCHLRLHSVSVKPGQRVARGAALGQVGLSGETEFAHVHFEVRRGATVIDPFTGEFPSAPEAGRCGASASPLWESAAKFAYKPAAFLAGGFAGAPVGLPDLERAPPVPPDAKSAALIAYVRVLGVRAGDTQTLTITGPDGAAFGGTGSTNITASKAQWLSFFGRKLTKPAWPSGTYTARYRLERDGEILIDERFSTPIK